MTDHSTARALVEELQLAKRDLNLLRPEQKREMENATGFSANACSHLFGKAADFIEQSLTPPEGDTVSEGVDEDEATRKARQDAFNRHSHIAQPALKAWLGGRYTSRDIHCWSQGYAAALSASRMSEDADNDDRK